MTIRSFVTILAVLLPGFAADVFGGDGSADLAGVGPDSSPATVRQTLMNRSGVWLDFESGTYLDFSGGTLADEPVKKWHFDFTDGKLARVIVTFVVAEGTENNGGIAKQKFEDLQKRFEQRYGTLDEGKGRAAKDDGSESCIWEVPGRLRPGASHTIQLNHRWTPCLHNSSHLEVTYSYSRKDADSTEASPRDSGGHF